MAPPAQSAPVVGDRRWPMNCKRCGLTVAGRGRGRNLCAAANPPCGVGTSPTVALARGPPPSQAAWHASACPMWTCPKSGVRRHATPPPKWPFGFSCCALPSLTEYLVRSGPSWPKIQQKSARFRKMTRSKDACCVFRAPSPDRHLGADPPPASLQDPPLPDQSPRATSSRMTRRARRRARSSSKDSCTPFRASIWDTRSSRTPPVATRAMSLGHNQLGTHLQNSGGSSECHDRTPKVVEQLLQERRFGPDSTKIGRLRRNVGRCWPQFANTWTILENDWSTLSKLSPISTKLSGRPEFAPNQPVLEEPCQVLATLGHHRPTFGPDRPTLVDSGRISAPAATARPPRARHKSKNATLRSEHAEAHNGDGHGIMRKWPRCDGRRGRATTERLRVPEATMRGDGDGCNARRQCGGWLRCLLGCCCSSAGVRAAEAASPPASMGWSPLLLPPPTPCIGDQQKSPDEIASDGPRVRRGGGGVSKFGPNRPHNAAVRRGVMFASHLEENLVLKDPRLGPPQQSWG